MQEMNQMNKRAQLDRAFVMQSKLTDVAERQAENIEKQFELNQEIGIIEKDMKRMDIRFETEATLATDEAGKKKYTNEVMRRAAVYESQQISEEYQNVQKTYQAKATERAKLMAHAEMMSKEKGSSIAIANLQCAVLEVLAHTDTNALANESEKETSKGAE